jgi:predicted secreted protein
MTIDNRSNKFVFTPFCLISQAYQAQGLVKYEHKSTIKPVMKLLIENDINIIQMPCPEAISEGLIREPKSIKKYDTKEFNDVCESEATKIVIQIKNILDSGYKIIAILGIEQSPSCCVNYIYTNNGMENRKGLFIEKIYRKLEEEKIKIPFIGINRKYPKKAVSELQNIIGS